MAIKLVPDLGAPLTVTAADLISESYAPDYNEWIAYILAAGGYVSGWMGWGGDFMKNVGIASLPWAAKKIYDRARGGASARPMSRRLSFRSSARGPVSRYPAPAAESQFRGVRITKLI